jgi:subtilisin family serine protease
MHRPRTFIPGSRLLASLLAAVAMVSGGRAALAQAGVASDGTGPVKHYVLMAPGTWGADQDAAVLAAGGSVTFRHAGSGIGTATSGDPGFLRRVLKGGAFTKGAEDMMVQWQEPASAQLAVTEDSVTPADDDFIALLWNMTAIEAPGAWALGFDGQGARVAVIDGGLCATHPDLAANIDVAASRSFVAGFTYDQDTGGATAFRHACHVAGIIAAVDNSIGTIGVAPRATIIGVKALHGGSGSFDAVIQSILYAADPIAEGGAGADIINLSLGATFALGGGNTGAAQLVAALNQAVNYAASKNVLVVCSAGGSALDLDHSGNVVTVPAQSGSAVAVSATAPVGYAVGWPNGATNFRDPASYTNYGRSAIWVSAPGGDSALPGSALCSIPAVSGPAVTAPCWVFDLVLAPGSAAGGYFFVGGTSMSAAHVSGVAALIVQSHPGISLGDLKNRLKNSADDEGEVGTDPFHGHGFVNARRAVTEGAAQQAAATPATRPEAAAPPRVELVIALDAGSLPEISFTLPAAGPVRLDLFDVAGRRVAALYRGDAGAGRTRVMWTGRDSGGQALRAGAYFAQLVAGGVRVARRVVLLDP